MGPPFEFIDVRCTVVARAAPRAVLDAARARAQGRGWSVAHMEVTDLSNDPLPADTAWPTETLGAMRYCSDDGGRSLFWSARDSGGASELSLGLYIGQYAEAEPDLFCACDRALVEMLALFGSDDALCVVLSFEDDAGIDFAPGLAGAYRAWLWGHVGASERSRVHAREDAGGWVVVRPIAPRATSYLVRPDTSEHEWLRAIQRRLDGVLRGA